MRVALVDDDEVLRRLLAFVLGGQGIEVVPLGSLSEARAWLSAHDAPDLVLCDRHLTDGDGLELLASRATPEGTPVVFVTADADESFRARVLAEGGRATLEKPLDPSTLGGRLRALAGDEPGESR